MLEGLQLSPNTLEVIARLCLATTFRDALLNLDPSFLGLLLDKYSSSSLLPIGLEHVCIQILSIPLPASYAIPRSAHSFYCTLVKRFLANPSVSTVRPLYSVMTGMGSGCLSPLSDDLLMRLQQGLIDLLKGTEDHTASLLCLAIFARLSPGFHRQSNVRLELANCSQESTINETGSIADTSNTSSHVESLFLGRRAFKALELAILQAIIASSENFSKTELTSHEILALATSIVKAVNTGDRVAWVKNSAHTLQKYRERILRRESNEVLRLAGLELWLALTDGFQSQPSEEDITIIEKTLERFPPIMEPNSIITAYCGRFSNTFIKIQLARILAVASRMPCTFSVDSMLEVKTARWILESFTGAVKTKNRLKMTLLITLTSNDFRLPLQKFLATRPGISQGNLYRHEDICAAQMAEAMQTLQKKLCTLFLLSYLHSSFDDIGFNPNIASNLLTKVEEVSVSLPVCVLFPSSFRTSKETLSLFQINCTPAKQARDWRGQLAAELSCEASQAHSRTIKFVSDVCRDLEERCHNVEHPREEERAKRLLAEEKTNALQKEVAVLEREALDRASNMESMEIEKLAIAEQLRDREISLASAKTEMEAVRQGAADTSKLAKKSAEHAHSMLETKALEHRIILTSKDALIKNQVSHISSLEVALNALRDKTNNLEVELTKANETHSLLLDQRHSEMEQAKKAKSKHSREMEKLRHAEKEERVKESELLKDQVCETLSDYYPSD